MADRQVGRSYRQVAGSGWAPELHEISLCAKFTPRPVFVISIQSVSHRYKGAKQDALDKLDLNINRGELFGLLGPNGAGKSTLISLLTGLRKLESGQILFGDVDMSLASAERDAIRRKIAWVPQEYAFYPAMSVSENLRFFARAQCISGPEIKSRIDEAIRITGLEQVVHRRAEHFSGGLKRRLNVAISLLGKPDYLLLDEPTVGIDPQSRHFILESIRDINAGGTTVIYSSHYMEEVQSLCDQIAIIDHGKLLKAGSLSQLLAAEQGSPANIELQTALPAGCVLPGNVSIAEDRLSLRAQLPDQKAIAELMNSLLEHNVGVSRLDLGSGNLEQLFLRLTHRSLRD